MNKCILASLFQGDGVGMKSGPAGALTSFGCVVLSAALVASSLRSEAAMADKEASPARSGPDDH